MTPCARGCCWSPFACATGRTCACHALDTPRTEPRGSDAQPYRDPTAREAIRNVMRAHRKDKP